MADDDRARQLATMDAVRKRLRFRCWHRGMKEMDLILGPFADRHLASLNDAQIEQFSAMLDVPDPDLYAWFSGIKPVPAAYENDLFKLIKSDNKSL